MHAHTPHIYIHKFTHRHTHSHTHMHAYSHTHSHTHSNKYTYSPSMKKEHEDLVLRLYSLKVSEKFSLRDGKTSEKKVSVASFVKIQV